MGVTYLQGSANSAFSAVLTRAATLTNVLGNLGFVVGYSGVSSDTATILDTQGNTWVALTPLQGTGDTVQAWYCLSLKAGSNIVTVTFGTAGSASRGILFAEETVSGGTITFDKQGINQASAATSGTSPSVTTTAAVEQLIGYFVTSATQTAFTAAGSATVRLTTTGQILGCITDQTTSAIGAFTQGVTFPTSSFVVSGIATFAFTATVSSISGNAGVAGATVAYSGTASGNVTADGSGNYNISGLANGPYTITPTLSGYTFAPTSQNETLSGTNITGVNFVATPVSGGGGNGSWLGVGLNNGLRGVRH